MVIGGDWNLRLTPTDFPHTTAEEFQFWIRDFPQDKLPNGWNWAVDPKTPTVRTAQKPYVNGENFTFVIDGFLTSPNVRASDVSTQDFDFRFADLQRKLGFRTADNYKNETFQGIRIFSRRSVVDCTVRSSSKISMRIDFTLASL